MESSAFRQATKIPQGFNSHLVLVVVVVVEGAGVSPFVGGVQLQHSLLQGGSQQSAGQAQDAGGLPGPRRALTRQTDTQVVLKSNISLPNTFWPEF